MRPSVAVASEGGAVGERGGVTERLAEADEFGVEVFGVDELGEGGHSDGGADDTGVEMGEQAPEGELGPEAL